MKRVLFLVFLALALAPGLFAQEASQLPNDHAAFRRACPWVSLGFDPKDRKEAVQPILSQFQRLARTWPSFARGVTRLESTPQAEGWPVGWYVWAFTTSDGALVRYNQQALREPDYWSGKVRAGEKSGWWPDGCGTLESTLTHEFGHAIHNQMRADPNRRAALAAFKAKQGASYRRICDHSRGNSPEEGFADAFMELTHSGDRHAYTKALAAFLKPWRGK